jgi:hypothetical protein
MTTSCLNISALDCGETVLVSDIMGANFSQSSMYSLEQQCWIKDHSLQYDNYLKESQRQLLQNFGKKLNLCYQDKTIIGNTTYKHFFITDGKWVIEFGDGSIGGCTTMVHCNPKGNYNIENADIQVGRLNMYYRNMY